MKNWPEDYKRYVLDDVAKYKGKIVLKKAGLIERCSKKYISPLVLHPNPFDEFSDGDIGPNFSIIGDYVDLLRTRLIPLTLDIFEEPLIIEKMEPDGYMLLNGHHRWFAALRMGVPKIHVQIVNMVHEEDMDRMLEKSDNTKRVSFDLDEVLLSAKEDNQAPIVDKLFQKRIKERLRKGAPEVIKSFQNAGYDVWVYTAGYSSEEYINSLFSMYEITIDGMVNGINSKNNKNRTELKDMRNKMSKKYDVHIHVDNDSVLKSYTGSKDFNSYDIFEKATDWEQGVIDIINAL